MSKGGGCSRAPTAIMLKSRLVTRSSRSPCTEGLKADNTLIDKHAAFHEGGSAAGVVTSALQLQALHSPHKTRSSLPALGVSAALIK